MLKDIFFRHKKYGWCFFIVFKHIVKLYFFIGRQFRLLSFFIRTSKFPPRLGVLKFYPSRGWIVLKMFLYSYCFLVKFSFSLLENHFEARFVLNLFLISVDFEARCSYKIKVYEEQGYRFCVNLMVQYIIVTTYPCQFSLKCFS